MNQNSTADFDICKKSFVINRYGELENELAKAHHASLADSEKWFSIKQWLKIIVSIMKIAMSYKTRLCSFKKEETKPYGNDEVEALNEHGHA